jgi:hypothetical protein
MKRFAMIIDADRSEITLLDPVAKRIATVPAAEYMEKAAAAMPQMPEQARKALEKMKIGVQSSKTGRSEPFWGSMRKNAKWW